MSRDGFGDLLLQIPKISSLRGDSTAIRIVPSRHQQSGILVTLDLKSDFFHHD
jgi:hypothetical protein